ncbi:MAG: hypothetical protein HY744_28645 [Deltaproteobacteria bacterium]|nr:hypothetical protein [Deltaproteobacteria bacterium]
MMDVTSAGGAGEQLVALDRLGERLGALRLREVGALEAMRRSLGRRGQLAPRTVFSEGDGLVSIDGFRRQHAPPWFPKPRPHEALP